MSRQVPCPNCGAPIEFKMGSAAVLACPYCRACVMRTGTNLSTLGQLADLVPTSPELGIGDTANMLGGEIVVGGDETLDDPCVQPPVAGIVPPVGDRVGDKLGRHVGQVRSDRAGVRVVGVEADGETGELHGAW